MNPEKDKIKVLVIGQARSGKTALIAKILQGLNGITVTGQVKYNNAEHKPDHIDYLGDMAATILKNKEIEIEELQAVSFSKHATNPKLAERFANLSTNSPIQSINAGKMFLEAGYMGDKIVEYSVVAPEIDLDATKAMGQVVYAEHLGNTLLASWGGLRPSEQASVKVEDLKNLPVAGTAYTPNEKILRKALEETKVFLMHIESRVGEMAFANIEGIVDKALAKTKKNDR